MLWWLSRTEDGGGWLGRKTAAAAACGGGFGAYTLPEFKQASQHCNAINFIKTRVQVFSYMLKASIR